MTDKSHPHLANPYVSLVDVFDAPANIRTTRARVVKDETDLSADMVIDLDEFKKSWGVFSKGSLSQLLNWNNIVTAGSAVVTCLTLLSDEAKVSKRSTYEEVLSLAAYPTSDVNLFLWGLTPEQAEEKITKIYKAVCDSVSWDVTCVHTKHTVSMHYVCKLACLAIY
ncbi:hypothetical protein B0H17DRAFT_1216406 [Mycena rosella]|uniref:Uncharacterized protein n=1 Tax=Mycena rosella TaxID=1033263 RepID=A0AAD7C9R4_MYCRO|nr:hypothetical protein B0H17DRAFT_1216406 [Mycena rosella]